MAALQSYNLTSSNRFRVHASIQRPSNPKPHQLSLQNLSMLTMDELTLKQQLFTPLHTPNLPSLLAIAEAAADRAEMHSIIGIQRNNWAHLLPNATNSITLAASIMAGIAPISPSLQLSASLLFAAATGMMMITNKIQPCQLAEEQRNAARLFRQLDKNIHSNLVLGTLMSTEETMERVIALDRAYPLPLLPGMLEKFPDAVEPTTWWPSRQQNDTTQNVNINEDPANGWSTFLEEEMKGVLKVLKKKDTDEYINFGTKMLNVNRVLGFMGPLLSGLAAVASSLIGAPVVGTFMVLVAVVFGAMSAVVNSLEHNGQVGMVFELCRNCAGHYRRLEEEIEANLKEEEVEKRENGEMFELKMALHLGRSIEEMKEFSKCVDDESIAEFAGKLF